MTIPNENVNVVVSDLLGCMIDVYGRGIESSSDQIHDLSQAVADLPKAQLLEAFNAMGDIAFDLAVSLGRETGSVDSALPIIRHVVGIEG